MSKEQENQIKLENDGKIALARLMKTYLAYHGLAGKIPETLENQIYQSLANYTLENIREVIEKIFPGKSLPEIFPKPNELA